MTFTPRVATAVLLAALLAGCGGDSNVPERAQVAVPRAAGTLPDSIYGAPATENVRVVPVEVEVRGLPEGWDGVRIAALSDFDLGRWRDNPAVAEAAVRAARDSGAELVALLGNYLTEDADTAALARVLAPLRGRPVLAVLGDADAREEPGAEPDSAEIRLRRTLRAAGVRVLQNERVPFVRGGDTAYIGGVEPFLVRRPDWRQAEIFGATAGSTVLLSHAPGVLARLAATERSVPLILAGGTGCGPAEPPGAVGLARLQRDILPGARMPQAERAFRVGQSTMLVTCGVGNSYIPARLGGAPEVLLVTLRRAGTADTDSVPVAPTVPDSLLQRFEVGDDSVPADTAAGVDSTG